MITYKNWSPSAHDTKGLGLDDRQDWYVAPCTQTRDSEPYEESNFAAQAKRLDAAKAEYETHSFRHWACGWVEIVLIAPTPEGIAAGEAIEQGLDNYPYLDENDVTERERVGADETWGRCYSNKQRIAYIRRYRSQFDFFDFADMLRCARGGRFFGYASELISR